MSGTDIVHESLRGEWHLTRVAGLVRSDGRTDVIEELCKLLNSLQKPPVERVHELEFLQGVQALVVTFGDSSAITLPVEEAVVFLKNYIQDRERFIIVMQQNRLGDPRVTGELARVQRQLKEALTTLRSTGLISFMRKADNIEKDG